MNLDEAPAESLVRSAQQGDRRAFQALYARFHGRVYRTAFRLLGERFRAEDMVQDVFITVFRRLEEFDFRSSFSTWLYRITVNACYAVMRKEERRDKYRDRNQSIDQLSPAVDGEEAETAIRRTQLRHHVEQALLQLNPKLRVTFVLRQMEGLSYDDIARVLDVSSGTVASRLARARGQIADVLRREGIDDTYFD